jgi:hypothetical protein
LSLFYHVAGREQESHNPVAQAQEVFLFRDAQREELIDCGLEQRALHTILETEPQ